MTAPYHVYQGEVRKLRDIADMAGIKLATLKERLGRGMTIDEATAPLAPAIPEAKLYTVNGESLPLRVWAKRLGADRSTLCKRRKRGWSLEATLTASPDKSGTTPATYIVNGESLTISQCADRLGLDKSAIFKRLARGWSIAKALTTPVDERKRRTPGGMTRLCPLARRPACSASL